MNLIDSGFKIGDKKLLYDILDDGFDIYVEGMIHPSFHQPEPYIPYPNLSYEENAKKMCESMQNDNVPDNEKTLSERLTDAEANIDYLMLLTDADSATEEETE